MGGSPCSIRPAGTLPVACYRRRVPGASQPEVIPLFPLPNVVLFPWTRVPLHVFEPRYRQLVKAALEADRQIGMIAVVPDEISEIAGDPALVGVGCAGVITDLERLPDGRFNLVLAATRRFRVLREPARRPGQQFRTAEVEWLEEPALETAHLARWLLLRQTVIARFCALVRLLAPARESDVGPAVFEDVENAALINGLCQLLDVPLLEKQGLLEANGVRDRAERLLDVFEFRIAELACSQRDGSSTRH